MKRYSRGQMLFYASSSVIIIVLLLFGFGLLDIPGVTEETRKTQESSSSEFPREFDFQNEAYEERIPSSGGELTMVSDSRELESGLTDYEKRNIDVYRKKNTAVVNINTETLSLNWFLEPVPQDGGTGSGSIIDQRGYILTNYHVVKDAYKVHVSLYDGSRYEGQVVGKDPESDLAVIKFDPGDTRLNTISFGNSDRLRVGQLVLAIGNPFGYDRTLTTGIVSGLGRPVRTSRNLVIRDMIQTDASINPGNSGGPLLNTRGEMIGINTMIYSPSGGSVGIGFAVPVNTARRVVPELIDHGRVIRGWIDIVPVQLEPSIVRYGQLPVSKGIMVSKVIKGGNAEEAGIRGGDRSNPVRYGRSVIYFGGDIIVEIDGTKVASLADMFSALEDNRPGEEVKVVVLREGRRREISVTLSQRPEEIAWE